MATLSCRAIALVMLALGLAPAACAQRPPRPDELTRAALAGLIGEAKCQHDIQCRTLGIGANPCGGPEQYLAWSIVDTDAASLREVAGRYAEQRRALHEKIGMSSVCVVLPEPGARCERPAGGATGHCVLVPTAPGRPLER